MAARYALTPYTAAMLAMENCRISQIDPNIVAQSAAFACVISALVRRHQNKMRREKATVLQPVIVCGTLLNGSW